MKYVELDFTEIEYNLIIDAMRADPDFEVSETHIDYNVESYLERFIVQQICQPRS